MQQTPLILLVEDDPTLGWLLCDELRAAGYQCTWVETAGGAIASLKNATPALMLLDLMLPDQSGFAVIRAARQGDSFPIIVLSARSDSEDKIRSLDLGADDYVTKPFNSGELLARVRARLRTQPRQDSDPVRFGETCIDRAARTVSVRGAECHLTPLEYTLLAHLAQRANRTVLREELAALSEPDKAGPRVALNSHMSRLRRKLGPDGEAIQTVWGIGYRLTIPRC